MREGGDRETTTYGAIQIDLATHTVQLHGKPVHLAKKEYQLLCFLVAHPGEDLTRQMILSEVWNAPPSLKTRTLDIHICSLRKKLSLTENLKTIPGVGYRLKPTKKKGMNNVV